MKINIYKKDVRNVRVSMIGDEEDKEISGDNGIEEQDSVQEETKELFGTIVGNGKTKSLESFEDISEKEKIGSWNTTSLLILCFLVSRSKSLSVSCAKGKLTNIHLTAFESNLC